MRRISILGLLLVAGTATGCMYPALSTGAGGATAAGGSAAGAAGSGAGGKAESAAGSAAGAAGTSAGGKAGSAAGSVAGAAGSSSGGKGGSAGSSAAGAAGTGTSSKGGSSGSSDAGIGDAPGFQPDAPFGGAGGGTGSGGKGGTGGSGGSSSVAVPTCPALTDPANGSVSAPTTTRASTAVYSCNTGYKLSGSMTRTCQADGTWNAAEPTCTLVDCGALDDPASGSVSAPTTTFGEQANYTCQTGYGMSGAATRTCQADGNWSDTAPTCTLKDCGALANPANGTVSASPTTYGSTANYACDTGYALTGSASRSCLDGGLWSGDAPTCPVVDCYSPPGISWGTVSQTGTTYGSTATYSCSTGWSLSGAPTRTCGGDGYWSGTLPICTQVDCGTPPTITHGSLLSSYSTTYNSITTYACDTGYLFSNGVSSVTCQANGIWSTPTPVCSLEMVSVTIAKSVYGTGTVASIYDSGINCGSACTGTVASYAYGSTIYLSATPDSGQTFLGWSYSTPNGTTSIATCTGLGTCSFAITSTNITGTTGPTVTANFSRPPNYMFTTSTVQQAYWAGYGLAGADALCNQLAAKSTIPAVAAGTYVAWLSSTSVNLLSRLGSASGWVRPDGMPVLNTVADIINGKVFYPPRLDENGTDLGADQMVFTNTNQDGTATSTTAASNGSVDCDGFQSNVGDSTHWIEGGLSSYNNFYFTTGWGLPCSATARLYCLGIDRRAQVATIPSQGRHAFVTKGTWTPGGGIYSADALCQSEANAAGLTTGGEYLALLTPTNSAAALRFNTTGSPWIRTDGIRITQSASEFFTTALFDVPPNLSADGLYEFSYELVWIGAASDGNPNTVVTDGTSNCNNWLSTSGSAGAGRSGETATSRFFNIIPSGPYGQQCNQALNLVCLEY